jgi:hypothetical protein
MAIRVMQTIASTNMLLSNEAASRIAPDRADQKKRRLHQQHVSPGQIATTK